MLRLVQMRHPAEGRRVARVEDNRLLVLSGARSVYACALAAIERGESLSAYMEGAATEANLDYDLIYTGASEWKLLPAFDHPEESARCLVSGTGLTHRKSADNRNAMHAGGAAQTVAMTDSMRIYAWGEEGGRPREGAIGVQPEWFYKGNGTILRAHGEALDVPNYADDGGEEAEIAAAYVIGRDGTPWRVGFAVGNEFSDHVMEAKNYLYLAPSKLRTCALGPELIVNGSFEDVHGYVLIERDGQAVWSQSIASGEANMVHTLANLEYHQFKYAAHRRPGDAHVHFFGTGGFSFGTGTRLEEGDEMIVAFEGYGRALRNTVRFDTSAPRPVEVRAL